MLSDLINAHGRDFTVQRLSEVATPTGRPYNAYMGLYLVQGLLRPLSSTDVQKAKQNDVEISHKVYVNGTYDIRIGDRLKDSENNLYIVTFPHNPMNFDTFLQIDVIYKGIDNNEL